MKYEVSGWFIGLMPSHEVSIYAELELHCWHQPRPVA